MVYRKLEPRPLDEMAKLYLAGKTIREIANEYGIGYATAREDLIQSGVEIRGKHVNGPQWHRRAGGR